MHWFLIFYVCYCDFMVSVTIVNGSFKNIYFTVYNQLLLVYMWLTDICIFILYSATLTNSVLSYENWGTALEFP